MPEPDFQHIGVELKTLPVDQNFRPKESTYVCTVPLIRNAGAIWETSTVKLKLSRVFVDSHRSAGHNSLISASNW